MGVNGVVQQRLLSPICRQVFGGGDGVPDQKSRALLREADSTARRRPARRPGRRNGARLNN
jgi:hypothetical protein